MNYPAEDSTALCLRCQIQKTRNCPLCKAYEMAKGDFELAKIYYVKKYGTHQKRTGFSNLKQTSINAGFSDDSREVFE